MLSVHDLPSVFVSKLLGYLDWRTKLSITETIPQWSEPLHSQDAWQYVINANISQRVESPLSSDFRSQLDLIDQFGTDEDDSDFKQCVIDYGKYFKSLRILLKFEDVYMCHMDRTLLNLVISHCISLRNLDVHLPRGIGFRILQCLDVYRYMLNEIPKRCGHIEHVSIHARDYDPVMENSGIGELFQFDDNSGLVSRLTSLDFSYAGTRTVSTADFLTHFINLKTLSTSDYLLSHKIIATLFANGLKNLYVYRNSLYGPGGLGGVHFTNFATEVDWLKLGDIFPNVSVHYNFFCSGVGPQTLKPNPLVKTVVFDSLYTRLKPEILESIGVHFPRIRVFVQLCSEWNYAQYDDDVMSSTYCENLMKNCARLETVMTCESVSSSGLLAMASTGHVKEIIVDRAQIIHDLDYVQEPEVYFDKRMALTLGNGWKPLSVSEFSEYSRVWSDNF